MNTMAKKNSIDGHDLPDHRISELLKRAEISVKEIVSNPKKKKNNGKAS